MTVLQGSVYPAQLVSDTDLTGSTVTCTVTAPDGTTAGPTPTVSGSTATVPVLAAQVGTYLVVWSTSGTVVGVVQDQFTVKAALIDLISLPDVKEELNIAATDTSKDAKLRRWLTAANDVVENVTGPIRPRTVTELFDGGGPYIVLSAEWVAALTSVTETTGTTATVLTEQLYGAAGSSYGYLWDRATNIVTRCGSAAAPVTFASGLRNVQVVYRSGMASIPDDIQIAAAELIKHWYRKAEPYRAGPFGQGDDDSMMVGNYMVPNAVMELLEPWRRSPQIA